MTVHLGTTAEVLPVVQLLSRQRSTITYDGSEFFTVLNRMALLEQHVLIEVMSAGQAAGYLLIQGGRVIFASCGVAIGQAASTQLAIMAKGGVLRLFALGEGAAGLAFAAVGAEKALDDNQDHSSFAARFAQLTTRQFSGVVAGRDKDQVSVWQLKAGKVTAHQVLTEGGNFGPFVQYVWTDQTLPYLTVMEPEPQPENSEAGETSVAVDFQPPSTLSVTSRTKPPSRSDALVWVHFRQVAGEHLGEAALRLCALMYRQHGTEVGPALVEALGLQVDRIAGRSVGQEFRRHVVPAPSPLEASI